MPNTDGIRVKRVCKSALKNYLILLNAGYNTKYVILITVVMVGLIVHNTLSQPQVEWSRIYGSVDTDEFHDVIQTNNGRYVFAGITRSFGAGGNDFWMLKTDANGDRLESRVYGGDSNDRCYSIVQTTDGGFTLAGETRSFGSGQQDFWLLKTNEDGDSLWSRTFGGNSSEICYSHIQTEDGGFLLVGSTLTFGSGGLDIWLVKTDENGDSLWSKTFGGFSDDECHSIIQTSDGGFALGGITSSIGAENSNFWLVKTNANGDSLWSSCFGGDGTDILTDLVQTADGGYSLTGYTLSFGGIFRIWLVRTDDNGDSLWARIYGGGGDCFSNSIVQVFTDGGFVLGGHTRFYGAGANDFWLIRTNAFGDSLWSQTFGGGGVDACYSMIRATDRGYVLTGYTESFGYGNHDGWLVKTTPDPLVIANETVTPAPGLMTLAAYPIPFNSRLTVHLGLPGTATVNGGLFDFAGRWVMTLVDGQIEAGSRTLDVDATGLTAGLYWVRLEANGEVRRVKVVLMK